VTKADTPRVACYLRVSTDEQGRSGYSIPDQRCMLTEYAERQGWQIVETIVDDGHSGGDASRPGLRRVMELATKEAIDVVLATKRDRFFRVRLYRLLTALYRLSKPLIMDPIVPPPRPHFWRKSDLHVRRVSGSLRQRLAHGVAGPLVAHTVFVGTERGVALPAAPLLADHPLDVPQQPLAVSLRAGALGHGEIVDVEVAAEERLVSF
jgi:hypothetical protein